MENLIKHRENIFNYYKEGYNPKSIASIYKCEIPEVYNILKEYQLKRCATCNELKPFDQFQKSMKTLDGCVYSCRSCIHTRRYTDLPEEYISEQLELVFSGKLCVKRCAKLIRIDPANLIHDLKKQKIEHLIYMKCNKCGELKLLGNFHITNSSKLGYRGHCKICTRKSNSIRNNDNRPKINEYIRNKIKTDAKFRLHRNFATQVNRCLKLRINNKHFEQIVGYKINDLINHLTSLFRDGMTMNNYGRGGWVIDHIVPVSNFNFISYYDAEFKKCWALSNLQPLWDIENQEKSSG